MQNLSVFLQILVLNTKEWFCFRHWGFLLVGLLVLLILFRYILIKYFSWSMVLIFLDIDFKLVSFSYLLP